LNSMESFGQGYQDDKPPIDQWISKSWGVRPWSNISSNGRHWPAPETILHPPKEYGFACLAIWIICAISLVMWYWKFKRISECPISPRQTFFVRLVCVIPVFVISSCLSTTIAIYSVFFGLIRHCYIGLCLFWYFELVCDSLGGFEGAVQIIAELRTPCLWWFEQPSAPGAGRAGSLASLSARSVLSKSYESRIYLGTRGTSSFHGICETESQCNSAAACPTAAGF
jgi:hypothetical protein